jgi:hypothetical protein
MEQWNIALDVKLRLGMHDKSNSFVQQTNIDTYCAHVYLAHSVELAAYSEEVRGP